MLSRLAGRSGLVPVELVSTPFVGTRQDPRAPPSLAKGLRLQLKPQVWLVGREGVTYPLLPQVMSQEDQPTHISG